MKNVRCGNEAEGWLRTATEDQCAKMLKALKWSMSAQTACIGFLFYFWRQAWLHPAASVPYWFTGKNAVFQFFVTLEIPLLLIAIGSNFFFNEYRKKHLHYREQLEEIAELNSGIDDSFHNKGLEGFMFGIIWTFPVAVPFLCWLIQIAFK